jgi:hypothetical protein
MTAFRTAAMLLLFLLASCGESGHYDAMSGDGWDGCREQGMVFEEDSGTCISRARDLLNRIRLVLVATPEED